MIRSVLIANRGEIAMRIIRTCRRLGLKPIAVYSDADRDAPHVTAADEAWHIGAAPARESYLRVEAIIEAAKRSGAQGIHPGYGFLSERAEFAAACEAAGIVFIGPSRRCIEAMGPKIAAKMIAEKAGVPTVPGYFGDDQSDARLSHEAERIGFPLMLKASAGGGGRGMRRVMNAKDFPEALQLARQEAEAAFGDPALLIEKLVMRPRHLEVQIAGDHRGNVVHLFERDCSVQRKNQKLLEEAPAPNLPPAIRTRLLERAVALGKATSYDNLGTVEFILDDHEQEPWFLEMNTRLQVEHPVTEAITGFDLVEWQIRIASGEPLPARQEDIVEQGHAIEARIVAESAAFDFRPSVGHITAYQEPSSIRIDSGVTIGSQITLHYDSLIAKAIAHGGTRAESLSRLAAGLRDFIIAGPETTTPFLIDCIEHPVFADGRATTRFIDEAFPEGWRPQRANARLARAIAAQAFLTPEQLNAPQSAWTGLRGFRVLAPAGGHATSRVVVRDGEDSHALCLIAISPGCYRLEDADGDLAFSVQRRGGALTVTVADRTLTSTPHCNGRDVHVVVAGERYDFAVVRAVEIKAAGSDAAGSGVITAPMPGIVSELKVAIGDTVEAGQTVAILESMKLFIPLAADGPGTVAEVLCAAGETVAVGARLMRIATGDTA